MSKDMEMLQSTIKESGKEIKSAIVNRANKYNLELSQHSMAFINMWFGSSEN